ncbi:branched-chain amino acid ABC transporter permease [Bradyrhizobium sp. HKCCYLS2038]|uniref:branched-chain amino acid ABC transporter permease n=1 Tax=unclassified Bradyrhizobium TaxID=2631580 RepID=UPI003EBCD404
MNTIDLVVQQAVNGLSLGSMYALLAVGFSVVYGIIGLINFAHFNIFMLGSFIALWSLEAFGLQGQSIQLHGWRLVGVIGSVLVSTMMISGLLGVAIERIALRPLRSIRGVAAMITTIGISYIILNLVLISSGADTKNFANPLPNVRWSIGEATIRLREAILWAVTVALMASLHYFIRHSKLGKALRATAQDRDGARIVGVDVDRVIAVAFFISSALAGVAGMIFGLYYNYTSFAIGHSAGLHAFTAAVLGGIGSIPGAMLGGLLLGLMEAASSQIVSSQWTEVIVFSSLILLLVFRPHGILGRPTPRRS